MQDKDELVPKRISERWNQILDQYLVVSDNICSATAKVAVSLHTSVQNEDFRNIRTSFVLRVTIVGILLTLTMFLFSCTSTPRRAPIPSSHLDKSSVQGRSEPLYIQRNSATVVPRVSGSETGSIYADTARPLDLYSDTVARHPGDYISIMIPESLRFNPQDKPKEQQFSSKDKSENAIAEIASTPVSKLSGTRSQIFTPTTTLKMQIVGIDNGIAYLRSTQTFGNNMGGSLSSQTNQSKNITITARVPQNMLYGRDLNADSLTNIEVTESNGGYPNTYQSDGWNQNISRIISSFAPDIDSDFKKLESFESKIEEQQRILSERFQALRQEQERFKKEQARMMNLRQRTEAQAAPAQQIENAPVDATGSDATAAQKEK